MISLRNEMLRIELACTIISIDNKNPYSIFDDRLKENEIVY